jgi:hypothetical protein
MILQKSSIDGDVWEYKAKEANAHVLSLQNGLEAGGLKEINQ